MGKNQQKRKDKGIAHARMVWAKRQLQAAQATKLLDDAYAIVMEYGSELNEDQLAQINQEVAQKKAEIEEFLMNAKKVFIDAVGDEDASVAENLL
jgi:hypothetical protein